ncbi:hypothetical protein [Sphingomonas aracearum]|uniref:HTH HARE-type domain-containing protein n=1 Tax=Sphingomonas aracearum TaxID=2283317 RepID=A0A369W090_9SPHN|nr:hypothetical protein [Sphingomonas aracearum]RDE07469.1 hypothetical protein DVW87_03760 [Sphingomonas aracearum]
MTDYMVEGLAKKRAEIAGEIERTHERLRALALDLEHVDATLRIVAPNMAVETIKPKVFRPPADWSKRGEMTRVVLSILRTARQPMTTREIAERMVVERGLVADTATLNSMGRRVACALRRQRELGRARSTEGAAGFWQLWEIVR